MLPVQLQRVSFLPVAHCRACDHFLLCWQRTMLCAEICTFPLYAGCWEVGAA